MNKVFLSLIVSFGFISAQAQFDIYPPNLMIHDSLGNERPLDFAFDEGYNASLFYYWASWCPPCRAKIEEMRPYAKAWEEEYKVKILLIVYDTGNSTDSILSLGYYLDENLAEIGDLYFVNDAEAEAAYDESDPFGISPWALNYLHRASDGRLLSQLGSSTETMDSIIRQFFDPISFTNFEELNDEIIILQNDQEINLSTDGQTPLNGKLLLYGLDGRMVLTQDVNNTREISISKSTIPSGFIYFMKFEGNLNFVSKIFVY